MLPLKYRKKYTGDRTFYMTVFPTDKDRIFFIWVYRKMKLKLSVLQAYLVILENYRDKLAFVICIS